MMISINWFVHLSSLINLFNYEQSETSQSNSSITLFKHLQNKLLIIDASLDNDEQI